MKYKLFVNTKRELDEEERKDLALTIAHFLKIDPFHDITILKGE